MEVQTKDVTIQSKKQSPKTYLVADEDSFVLHTDAGIAIFLGRWERDRLGKNHMGLVQFSSLMTRIWKAYHQDDPYANLYIIKTYEAIVAAQEKFKKYELMLQKQIDNIRGFKFNLYRHPSPEPRSIRFATLFGYMGAVLVENMDYINRLLFTFSKKGLVPDINLTTSQLMSEVQTVFKTPTDWRPTGITRKDIRENNDKAREAYEKLGPIPPEVLNNEIKLKFLPEPRRHEKIQKA